MKLKLFSLCSAIIFLTIACGGGGGSTSIFNFFGVWYSSLTRAVNSCDLSTVPSSGDLLFNITQNENVVTIKTGFDTITFQGSAGENSFTSVSSESLPFDCELGGKLKNVTSTLSFSGASGDSADTALLSIFGSCDTLVTDTMVDCEITYTGSAIRVSGGSNASGENFTNDQGGDQGFDQGSAETVNSLF